MAAGDLLQLTLKGRFVDQQIRNVFHYIQTSGSLTANAECEALNNSFVQQVIGQVDEGLRCQSISTFMFYDGVETINAFDETAFDKIDFSSPLTGSGGGDTLPPYDSYGFTAARKRRDIRDGRKRFCGVLEVGQSAGILTPAFITDLNLNVANRLGDIITSTQSPTSFFTPVVVKRIKYTTDEGKTAYRLPENASEFEYYNATDWTLDTYLTTQNTRKRGRGV